MASTSRTRNGRLLSLGGVNREREQQDGGNR